MYVYIYTYIHTCAPHTHTHTHLRAVCAGPPQTIAFDLSVHVSVCRTSGGRCHGWGALTYDIYFPVLPPTPFVFSICFGQLVRHNVRVLALFFFDNS